MKLKQQIDNAIAAQNAAIENIGKAIEALRFFQAQYLDLELDKATVSYYGGYIDFNTPSRNDVRAILSRIKGGKWSKCKNSNESSLNYISEREIVPGVKFRIWGAEPPPSCKLVEEDVLVEAVPAHIEKRFRMVCDYAAAIDAPALGVA